jgi:RND family efflux transporter MFP subunit
MKKYRNLAIAAVMIVLSFTAGYWSSHKQGGMKPEPVYEGGDESAYSDVDSSALPAGAIEISPEKQQIIGIRTAIVEKKADLHTLRALARVAVDDRKVYVINSSATGWVREVSPITVGSFVKKDQPLTIFYSPEFLAAEQSYFYALNALDRFSKEEPGNLDQLSITKANIRQYSDTLRNLGMGEKQIEEIGEKRQFTDMIKVATPTSGIVISRTVYTGQRFERGTEFFKIADLSSVWIFVDTFENEAQYLKPGATVKVVHPHLKKTFQARVSADLPQFDPATRTLKVRLEANNPGYVLRPEMFVDVELPLRIPSAIIVPADAVIFSGTKKTVFVDLGNGYFEPREVQTGWRLSNKVEITKGLKPGERIVVSGNFLVDSESKIRGAGLGSAQPGLPETGAHSNHQ